MSSASRYAGPSAAVGPSRPTCGGQLLPSRRPMSHWTRRSAPGAPSAGAPADSGNRDQALALSWPGRAMPSPRPCRKRWLPSTRCCQLARARQPPNGGPRIRTQPRRVGSRRTARARRPARLARGRRTAGARARLARPGRMRALTPTAVLARMPVLGRMAVLRRMAGTRMRWGRKVRAKGQTVSLTIGVDVGGTKVAAGVVDQQGGIVEKLRLSTPAASPHETANVIAEAVRTLLQPARDRRGRHRSRWLRGRDQLDGGVRAQSRLAR